MIQKSAILEKVKNSVFSEIPAYKRKLSHIRDMLEKQAVFTSGIQRVLTYIFKEIRYPTLTRSVPFS